MPPLKRPQLLLQSLAKRAFRSAGLEVQRLRGAVSEEAILRNVLRLTSPAALLDVGANVGQYARSARQLGFRGRIISFEPLSGAYAALSSAAHHDPGWVIAPRAALGRARGSATLNISQNAVSSSLLPMQSRVVVAAPAAGYVGTEAVSVYRLDELAQPLVPSTGWLMLKIDTQGYEREVLGGATGLIERIAALQVELSLMQLYAGAPSLGTMVSYIEDLGFEPFGLAAGFKDPGSGRQLQAEGFFVRPTFA